MSASASKRIVVAAAGACALAAAALSWPVRGAQQQAANDDRPLAEFAQPLDPETCGIGKVVPDLAFTDLDSEPGRLSDYADRKALVIVVRDVGCPVGKLYGLRTAAIEQAFAARGVAFLFVDTSDHDSPEECRAEAKEYGFAGRYTIDRAGRFGFHLKARTTTDVFVLDGERKLRYRGAIDDQIGRGVTREKATREYLKEALESVLRRQLVADAAMTAPGCLLPDFAAPAQPEPAGPALPWHGRVEQIVQARCQRCHREGGPGPFELTSREDVAGRAAMIRKVVTDGVMPPWYATEDSGPFDNDVALTRDEKLDLLRWLQSDRLEGDPKDAPPPREWPTGWQIGAPDLVVATPRPIEIPATGVVDYITVDSPSGLDHDVWVQAVQILPEHSGIVHHVLVHAVYPDEKEADFFESYLPGRSASHYPDGMAHLLKKGAVLRFNLHYTPNGTPCTERTQIGFKFATAPPAERIEGRIARNHGLLIPPGATDYTVVSELRFPFRAKLRRFVPHMHLRGKSARVELTRPDGTTITPLVLWRWHPNWQFAYELSEPIEVPRGSVLRIISVFDNSAANVFNPDPTKTVHEGPQIFEEMAGAYVEWIRPAQQPPPKGGGGR